MLTIYFKWRHSRSFSISYSIRFSKHLGQCLYLYTFHANLPSRAFISTHRLFDIAYVCICLVHLDFWTMVHINMALFIFSSQVVVALKEGACLVVRQMPNLHHRFLSRKFFLVLREQEIVLTPFTIINHKPQRIALFKYASGYIEIFKNPQNLPSRQTRYHGELRQSLLEVWTKKDQKKVSSFYSIYCFPFWCQMLHAFSIHFNFSFNFVSTLTLMDCWKPCMSLVFLDLHVNNCIIFEFKF